MNELTHLDLFSGIGGFALAARRAGFRTIGFGETAPYCRRILREQFPGIPNRGDVTATRQFNGIGRTTVFSAGYPCQGESLVGDRLGELDHRWLWPATRGLISAHRPTWFIGENVLGHVSMGLDTVLTDLEGLGYAAQPFIIPACAVGADHERARVWILSHCGGDGLQGLGFTREGEGASEQINAWCQTAGILGAEIQRRHPRPDESGVGRIADGIPDRAHRLHALGNAIDPYIAEVFFRIIAKIETRSVAAV